MNKQPFLVALTLSVLAAAHAQTPAVSNDEAVRLAHRIESEVNAGNPASLNRLIDPGLLVARIAERSPILKNETYRSHFQAGVAEATAAFGTQGLSRMKGGSLHPVRIFEQGGVRHMLLRMSDAQAALNYYDFMLVKVKDSIKAADVYIYASDEYMSFSMSRLVNAMNMDKSNSADLNFLAGLMEYYQKKDYAGLKQYFETHDSKMKDDKGLYLFYVISCKYVDVNKYQEVLEHYITHFPDAAGGYLMLVDLYYTKKDGPNGLAAVEKLDSLIGKDPFLDYFRGRCYDLMGKRAEAEKAFDATYRFDPTFERNIIRLIVTCAANKENDKAKTVIGEYKKSPVFTQENLDAVYNRFPDLK